MVPRKRSRQLLELFFEFLPVGPLGRGAVRRRAAEALLLRTQTRKDHEKGDLVSHTHNMQRTVSHLGLVSRRSHAPWRVGDRVLAISMVSPVLDSSLTTAERSLAFGD